MAKPVGKRSFEDNVTKMALAAMQGAPPSMKVIILIIAVTCLACTVCAVDMVAKGDCLYGTICLGIYAILTVILIKVLPVWLKLGSLQLECWHRTVPAFDLKPKIQKQLGDLLGNTCYKCYLILSKTNSELEKHQIRANIFLANYKDAYDGHAYSLQIPGDLRKNMDRREEWSIRFSPGCGAVGLAYLASQPQIAICSEADGEWAPIFELTEEQTTIIHPELKWVLSMQIRHPDTEEVIGVLSIDGLVHSFDNNQLRGIARYLDQELSAYGVLLSQQPKVRIVTGYQEVQS